MPTVGGCLRGLRALAVKPTFGTVIRALLIWLCFGFLFNCIYLSMVKEYPDYHDVIMDSDIWRKEAWIVFGSLALCASIIFICCLRFISGYWKHQVKMIEKQVVVIDNEFTAEERAKMKKFLKNIP